MANVDSKFGARLVGTLLGSPYQPKASLYTVPASDSTALFKGDFVVPTGTSADGDDNRNHPVITQAAAGNENIVGIVIGFLPNPSYLNQIYRTASTLRTAIVCDDPWAIFEIQASTDAAIVAGDLQANADIVVGAGSTFTGLSGMELDQTTISTTNGQLRILGLIQREDNELGLHAKLLCMVNEHVYKRIAGT